MNPEIIKARMRMRGVSVSDIARTEGVSPSAVHRVIHGERSSYRLANAVSGVIGTPVERIWPNKYKEHKKYSKGIL